MPLLPDITGTEVASYNPIRECFQLGTHVVRMVLHDETLNVQSVLEWHQNSIYAYLDQDG